MKNFTQDIMGYTSAKEFEKEEWIDVNEDRGIVRRQRVYRKLLMSMGMYKDAESEEDFAYLRNYRNMIQGIWQNYLTVNCMYTAAVHFSCWEKSADWGGVFRKEIHFLTLFF